MPFDRDDFEKMIFSGTFDLRRFTQDSPIYPDVWLRYFSIGPKERVDLLLTPHRLHTASELLKHLRERLTRLDPHNALNVSGPPWQLANTGDSVVAELTFQELIRVALPMTRWWQEYLWDEESRPTADLVWLEEVSGAVSWSQSHDAKERQEASLKDLRESGTFISEFEQLVDDWKEDTGSPSCLWSVSLNRKASFSLTKSVATTKADASRRLFDIDGSGICWAIIDSGVDATHPAFRKMDVKRNEPFADPGMEKKTNRQPNYTRVVATYDFTQLRTLMANLEAQITTNRESKQGIRDTLLTKLLGPTGTDEDRPLTKKAVMELLRDLERAVKNGRTLDWSVIGPLLRVPHNQDDYRPPKHPHGTHVAGILGADMRPWEKTTGDALVGMCPGIEIYDLRVFDDKGDGDEFSILAALHFVRWLNKQKDQLIIHGVNLSLSLPHAVVNFACGRTPVCEECQRLVAEGTVVVAAAGNRGQAVYLTKDGPDEGFRTLSITDPGNAEAVITVGSTHRSNPHMYGVSYFSSRGPTGDGRIKPDLLAPGEKVVSTVPAGGTERMDGTSMAAPHVSGAAALLLARHRELIGQPTRVKEVLCQSAVDLERERYFQGYGMVDTLRALQSL
jgi:serine protease AprX